MIYDTLQNIACYRGLGKNMDRAIECLTTTDFSNLAAGRYEVDGANVFFMIQEPVLREPAESQFEVHRRYIDIQLALTPGEWIGVKNTDTIDAWAPFDVQKDIGFSDTTDKGVALPLDPGCFMILYPQDAHMPCLRGCADSCRKVVVKVAIE